VFFVERMEGEICPKALTLPIDTLLERQLSRSPEAKGFPIAFLPPRGVTLSHPT